MAAAGTGGGAPSLAGRRAVVTGGGRGTGRAIALAFADEGADVAVVDAPGDRLAEVGAEIEARGRRALTVAADVADVGGLEGVFGEVVAGLGGFEILVNDAGARPVAAALETGEELWDEAFDVNAKALFFCGQQAGRHFVAEGKRGKVVNVCSAFARIAAPGLVAYCASMGAALQVTRALAAEWARAGVNVNAIGPTLLGSEPGPLGAAGALDARVAKLPARALPTVADVADAAVFLAGPRSDFVHGHMLAVDAGETIV